MDFDNSWKALTQPDKASKYFDTQNPPPFQSDAPAYSKVNAWWLAEIARLTYREGRDEAGDKALAPSRAEILKAMQLRETQFFNQNQTQCAIIEANGAASAAFAVLVF